MKKGFIFDIRRYSIHDGPGIRTAVFFKGCPLECWYCHNPEGQSRAQDLFVRANRCIRCGACVGACPSVAVRMEQGAVKTDMAACRRCGACADACPTGARELAGREIDTDSVVAELERDRPFYDESGGGVTFTGGEPLEQPGFLGSLLRACRQVGIRTAVDTSGAVPWEAVEAIVPSTDLFLYDLKLVDDSKHRRFTGASNRPVLDNLKRLCSSGCAVRLRIPLIPGINDSPQELGDLAECASGLSGLLGVDLLPFHAFGGSKYESLGRPYRMAGTRPLSGDRVTQIRRLFEARGLRVGIGG